MAPILPRIAERDGTPRVALEAARHLARCAGCAEQLLRLRELNGLLDALPPREVPAGFSRGVLRALRSKAGGGLALLLLAGLGAVGARLISNPPAETIGAVIRDPFEAAGTMLSALVSVLFGLLDLGRAALGTLEIAPLELGGRAASGFRPSAGLLLLAVGAALLMLGSWTAFGFGVRHRIRELSEDARLPR
jgi:hypothetical protein